jgi:glyoxylase-like metal-dependent hydrolase (beta-lactamase superfamily II)
MLKRFPLLVALLACALTAVAQDNPVPGSVVQAAAGIEFAIIKTADMTTREGFTFSGGDYSKRVKLQHVAVLVRHPQGSFLFDSGLGKKVDEQVKADMPFWSKPFASHGAVTPARTQIDGAGLPLPSRIILSHAHWDHASGLVDFPESEVWVNPLEKTFLNTPHAGGVLKSQINAPSTKWVTYEFQAKPYKLFAQSLDLFGDGSAVLVPLSGHTPGSTGLYLTLKSGKQYFFVGDAVWNGDAIKNERPKMWLASEIADQDPAQTLESVVLLHRLQQANPQLLIVPAHDAAVQDGIGYFPKFVK